LRSEGNAVGFLGRPVAGSGHLAGKGIDDGRNVAGYVLGAGLAAGLEDFVEFASGGYGVLAASVHGVAEESDDSVGVGIVGAEDRGRDKGLLSPPGTLVVVELALLDEDGDAGFEVR